MKFNIIDEIPYPRHQVFATHRDCLLELVPYFGNVDRVEIPSRREEGNAVHFENVWYGKTSDVPALIRPLLKDEMLKWTDFAVWDEDVWRCDWNIELAALPGAITARGTNRFRDESGETVIEMNGEFAIHPDRLPGIPAFAARRALPVLERFIVGLLEPNLRDSNRAVQRYIEDNI